MGNLEVVENVIKYTISKHAKELDDKIQRIIENRIKKLVEAKTLS